MTKLKSINPSDYSEYGELEVTTPEEVANIVAKAKGAQEKWEDIGLSERVKLIRAAFAEIGDRKEELIKLEAQEMGMPIADADFDFDGTMDYANWYLDNAEKYLSPEVTFENDSEIHKVFYEPVGTAAVIVPWNFPFANVVWGATQDLIAGNTVVLKHSEECPFSGKFIEEILNKHLPDGVFNEVYGDGTVGSELMKQPIDMVSFTGSTKIGEMLYEQAGKKFIRAVMELGGSAPAVVFEDADLSASAENVCMMRLFNAGQCCDGLKRLIVHESKFDEVVEKITANFAEKKIGAAGDKNTEIGPLVAKRQLDLLIEQVEDAKAKGAKVHTGGNSLEEKLGGAFFEPTVLSGVTKDMRVWNEEVFGPVLPIMTFSSEEEAIELANDTSYGLGSYLYTSGGARADRVASALKTGMVSVNGTNYIMPFNPFGGYKKSGLGREHGKFGFHEVTQVKVVAKNK